jgi:hypothetical protein
MMTVLEVLNAIFITYVGTEYMMVSAKVNSNSNSTSSSVLWHRKKHVLYPTIFMVGVNGYARTIGASSSSSSSIIRRIIAMFFHNEILSSFHRFRYIFKICFIVLIYIVVLYWDCCRFIKQVPKLSFFHQFLPLVGSAFLRVLPIYPFVAVIISFMFLFIIRLFEILHVPLEYLNWPIYYGTLYGPFSLVYYRVKQRTIQDCYSLPTSTVNVQRKGHNVHS